MVILRQPPEQILAGLRTRGVELRGFENPEFLAELQDTFGEVAEALRGRVRMKVLDLAVASQGPEEIASRILEEVVAVQSAVEPQEQEHDPEMANR
jgi:thymidylate kinase